MYDPQMPLLFAFKMSC